MAVEVQSSPSKPLHYQGKPIQSAQLQTINFSRLLYQEPAELNKLLHLCKTEGFFYTDLQDIDGRRMLDDKARLLEVMERFFSSSHDEKNEVSRYELSKRSSIALPSILKNDHDVKVFEDFIAGSSINIKTMLSALSTALGLQGGDRFESSHRNGQKSNSTLATFRYIPGNITSFEEVGHQKHTDIGSLTLLFSEQWGLQVQRPGPENHGKWEFVEPWPGHTVISVGDSLRFASGHQLCSCIHQVVPIYSSEHRYSNAYFLRPEDEARYKDSNGKWVTARVWHDAKYEVFTRSIGSKLAQTRF